VGKVLHFHDQPDGLIADVRIAQTALGDETLAPIPSTWSTTSTTQTSSGRVREPLRRSSAPRTPPAKRPSPTGDPSRDS
jgi:hypothetical protein